MFSTNPINKAIIVQDVVIPIDSNALFTAFRPKYGSITAAFRPNLSLSKARTGLNDVTNSAAQTFNIIYHTVAFINPAND